MGYQSINLSRLIFMSLLGFIYFANSTFAQSLVTFDRAKLLIITSTGNKSFEVELAVSDRQLSQGLMYRRSLAADAGMLFAFGVLRNIQMWMKNTFIPLDMIFIDPKGKIINIVERTIPHSEAIISSEAPAWAVLELKGGSVSRLGIKPGDTVVHSIFQ